MNWIHIRDRIPTENDAPETGRILIHAIHVKGSFDCWGWRSPLFAFYHKMAKDGKPTAIDYWAAIPVTPKEEKQ
jgi:hypothetical protein